MFQKHPNLLSKERSRLLVIDVQEKLTPSIQRFESVERHCIALCETAMQYDVPIRITEQYPGGLGPTIPSLAGFDSSPAEKLAFSAAYATGWGNLDVDEPRDQVVICGIETHICVLQTALDLVDRAWSVAVVVDAIGSRSALSHETGLRRLESAGVQLVTTEMVLFEWAGEAGSDDFKAVSKRVRSLAENE